MKQALNQALRYVLVSVVLLNLVAASSYAQEQTRRLSLEKSQVLTFNQPNRPGKIVIQLVNATISVRAESRSDVQLLSRYQESARGEEAANWSSSPKELRIEKRDNEIHITGPDEETENVQYMLDLRVPRRTALSVNTVNSGRVDATDLLGDVEISTTNGSVALRGLEGSVLVNTINGPVDIFPGALNLENRWDINSMNGNISVMVERSLPATFELQTFHGSIESELEMEQKHTDQGPAAKTMQGKRNGGGAKISISTMNGVIRIRPSR